MHVLTLLILLVLMPAAIFISNHIINLVLLSGTRNASQRYKRNQKNMIEQPTPVVLITEVPARINYIQNIEIAEKQIITGKILTEPNSLPSSI